MKIIYFCAILVYITSNVESNKFEATLGHIKPKASAAVQTQAVKDLILRLLDTKASKFSVNVDPTFIQNNKDTFEVSKEKGVINIVGTSGVAAATGFHHYLKYFCNAHISWEASQLNLPEDLPDVNVTITLNDRFRYYQNTCTTSYSFVWWNWQEWEKHIDWMALNSFNLVLAFNGQEAIWERVYKKLNFTKQDIDEHFTGPAFLSWLRMGNMRGWGGPLSASWHERSILLQKKILERMRSLGIIPVLPAFAGHLPRAVTRIYPNVNVTKMETWNSFNDSYCCPYFLDPTEELFKVIGKLFIEEQTKEFGTDHIYNCDSFNENDPTTTNTTYIGNVGKSIYAAMTAADPDAIWLMQGWLFVHSFFFWTRPRAKALLTSVPKGKMIILDLQSEEFPQYDALDQYFGQPYIWCMLHDFGGTLGMFGSANIINMRVIQARHSINSTMIGTGLTPEGINQNYVIYDLMTEQAWRKESANLTTWFENYALRRYGKSNAKINEAWQLLKNTVYDFSGLHKLRGKYAITWTPTLKLDVWTWYNYSEVFDAWDIFVRNADDLKNSPGFLHDLVDLTRQVLQIYGDIYYPKIVTAFRDDDYTNFSQHATVFMEIFDDLELILSTNKAFLLGPWIEAAKSCGNNSQESNLFEYNARNQITLWGPEGEIINYANKQWSGIVANYYKPRWEIFINRMNYSLLHNTWFSETAARREMFRKAEEPFTFDRTVFPVEPTGNTIEAAKAIHKRWNVRREVPKEEEEEEQYFGQRLLRPILSFV
ncbi:alpha-N-acetylglucosaminidase isoform X2 [Diabrotica virgifera virgifera]|uniref:Alpha-N-acetylglucosaminidase n=1 Tax=Diabrotica virgifera virgifera TaxID=50390 RepID=A0ABM5KDX0_DIAVI|nr:alpha-N-acetylglucosaminidase isoform X2 [Diabrotica virgifera virgifera]